MFIDSLRLMVSVQGENNFFWLAVLQISKRFLKSSDMRMTPQKLNYLNQAIWKSIDSSLALEYN